MLKINTKLTLAFCILLMASFVSAQIEVEHLSTAADPTVRLMDTGTNNFTRLFFGNVGTNKEWRISSRAFAGGIASNKFDFNHYDGSSTSTYLSFDADDMLMTAAEDVVLNKRLFVNNSPTVSSAAQVEVYTESAGYAGLFHNETNSSVFNYGALIYADGPGTGARIGVFGNATATSGVARGVYGLADSSSGNEYGVYGEASGASGSSWGLYSNGDIWYSGTLTAPSDRRLKKNIKKLQANVLDKLMLLEAKTYEYDQSKYPTMNFAKGPQIGFIAQDLQILFPETVIEQTHTIYEIPGDFNSKESQLEVLGVDYMKMIPILTSAIQEQVTMIEEVQAENKSLKAEVEAIKIMLAELKD